MSVVFVVIIVDATASGVAGLVVVIVVLMAPLLLLRSHVCCMCARARSIEHSAILKRGQIPTVRENGAISLSLFCTGANAHMRYVQMSCIFFGFTLCGAHKCVNIYTKKARALQHTVLYLFSAYELESIKYIIILQPPTNVNDNMPCAKICTILNGMNILDFCVCCSLAHEL